MQPSIVEKDERGTERVYDLVSRLLKDRIIFVGEEINSSSAASIIAQLLYLEADDCKAPITMYINSPGGSVTDGLAIYDIMNNIKCPVRTVCVGMSASMGAVLLSSGTRGMRYCLPNSCVMIHQPLGGAHGQATEVEIEARRMLSIASKLYEILSGNSNLDVAAMAKECERNNYLSPEEAIKMGLVDKIIDCVPKAWRKDCEVE